MRRHVLLSAVLKGGLIAGTLDILYATIFSAFHGVAPMRILQSVATGWLGKPAFDGGIATASLGLASHYLLMLIIAAIYCIAAQRLPLLRRHYLICGAFYGVVVYFVMNFAVLPLSAYPGKFRFDLTLVATSLLVHAFFIGVPIAWAARALTRKEP